METSAANADSDIIAFNIARLNNATLDIMGSNLGVSGTGRSNNFRIGDAASESAFWSTPSAGAFVGGSGASGTTNISIVPWAIGEDIGNNAIAATNMGNSLVTYVAGIGFSSAQFHHGIAPFPPQPPLTMPASRSPPI